MLNRTTNRWMLALLCLLLVMPSTLAQQTDESPDQFTLNPDYVIGYGEQGNWDGRHTASGAVIYHEGQFHMFRNGYRYWMGASKVAYHVSDDGVNWEQIGEPVFEMEQMPFFSETALLNSAIVEEDGTWTFYITLYSDNADFESGVVRATADSPTDAWVVDESFVLNQGEAGEWDSTAINVVDVIKTANGYEMYYTGNQDGFTAIGRATSEDGIVWEKYDNPETTDAPYAYSDPVLIADPEHAWEVNIQDPRVVVVDGRYVMLYSSFDGNFRNFGYGIVTSEDGINWQRSASNPMIERSAFLRPPWYPELAYHDGTYFAYIEADSRRGTDIFVATYSGDFAEE